MMSSPKRPEETLYLIGNFLLDHCTFVELNGMNMLSLYKIYHVFYSYTPTHIISKKNLGFLIDNPSTREYFGSKETETT